MARCVEQPDRTREPQETPRRTRRDAAGRREHAAVAATTVQEEDTRRQYRMEVVPPANHDQHEDRRRAALPTCPAREAQVMAAEHGPQERASPVVCNRRGAELQVKRSRHDGTPDMGVTELAKYCFEERQN